MRPVGGACIVRCDSGSVMHCLQLLCVSVPSSTSLLQFNTSAHRARPPPRPLIQHMFSSGSVPPARCFSIAQKWFVFCVPSPIPLHPRVSDLSKRRQTNGILSSLYHIPVFLLKCQTPFSICHFGSDHFFRWRQWGCGFARQCFVVCGLFAPSNASIRF